MNSIARRTPRNRRIFTWIGLAIVLGLASVSLTQCRTVQDSVTGLDLRVAQDTRGRSDCVKSCRATYREGRRKEQSRYREAIKACSKDKKCIKGERDLHRANLRVLGQDLIKCKKSCYNEGSGRGGN